MLNPENSGNQGFGDVQRKSDVYFLVGNVQYPINSVKLVKTNIPSFTKSQIPLKLNRLISKIMTIIRGLLL